MLVQPGLTALWAFPALLNGSRELSFGGRGRRIRMTRSTTHVRKWNTKALHSEFWANSRESLAQKLSRLWAPLKKDDQYDLQMGFAFVTAYSTYCWCLATVCRFENIPTLQITVDPLLKRVVEFPRHYFLTTLQHMRCVYHIALHPAISQTRIYGTIASSPTWHNNERVSIGNT